MNLTEIRKAIIDQMPVETRFQSTDAQIILQHQALLHTWKEEIVQSFYNLVYSHPATSQIFQEGERAAREDTLRNWWQRVVDGPIDERFWDWMTYVGLVHVMRKVKNPMMLSVWGHIFQLIVNKATTTLSAEDAHQLIGAFTRFGQTLTSLVAESYLKGVADATGTSLTLLENLASQEVSFTLENLKRSLG